MNFALLPCLDFIGSRFGPCAVGAELAHMYDDANPGSGHAQLPVVDTVFSAC